MAICLTPDELAAAILRLQLRLPDDAYLVPGEDRQLTTHNRLPHSKLIGKIQHIVWRTADSIPQVKAHELIQKANHYRAVHPEPWDTHTANTYRNLWEKQVNSLIDKGYGKCLLRDYNLRKELIEVITNLSVSIADILAFTIMPNHVHLLLRNSIYLDDVVSRIKSLTALRINRLIRSDKAFWHRNYYDRMMRSRCHLETTLYYIINNPRYLKPGEYTVWLNGVGDFHWNRNFIR